MVANSTAQQTLYHVAFVNNNQVYEVYARSVVQSNLMGFIEIEDLVFGERSAVVVDPSEEKLASEFADVERCHVPMHSIIRIDEVTKRGNARITPADGNSKITDFPSPYRGSGPPGNGRDK
ncbi:DUF1820 family protein [Salinisphaera sp. USBA-960]|uniref:DUF1820 family protein n=1 Tax=Salinisphaera orenii TaxID=856731 RepID=UPI000DBE594C|nr:DUF1820 family protein [Salifodinibacter halophilus]NNC27090.1 DUF1820 family protein [Salifodinibacter halophilus]